MKNWCTRLTLRFCGVTSVTSRPSKKIRPVVGFSSPAISLISVVLPAPVSPSSTLNPSRASVRLVSWRWVSAPTFLPTPLSSRLMVVLSGAGRNPAAGDTGGREAVFGYFGAASAQTLTISS